MPSELVSIIGDGQMALVMADALITRGAAVRLWGPFEGDVRDLARTRRSPRLADFVLDRSVQVTADDAEALDGATMIISAIPAQFLRSVWERLGRIATPGVPIVSVTKGIEIASLTRPTEVIVDAIRHATSKPSAQTTSHRPQFPMCALSGPNIAAEMARRLPASMVAASADESCASHVQDLLRVPWLRVYRHDDVIGVEVTGATKNVIAMAAGMVDGLGAGNNAKSALLARGLAEIARLGVAMGARLDTFFGVAGVGDLATTCFSPEGRNRTCGERLARGESLEEIVNSTTSIVEGISTTQAVKQLATEQGVDMPITNAVHAILFEGLAPKDAIRGLMSREPKAEQVG